MMTIVLSACLLANPATCKDFKLPLDGDMDASQCAMYAPPFFAQWAEEHPDWAIKRWKCQSATQDET